MMLLEDWTEDATKQVFMITDAPPHGNHLHDSTCLDEYPAGSPDGLVFEDLMKEFKKREIEFNVIKSNTNCNRMIEVMKECHDEV